MFQQRELSVLKVRAILELIPQSAPSFPLCGLSSAWLVALQPRPLSPRPLCGEALAGVEAPVWEQQPFPNLDFTLEFHTSLLEPEE